MTPEQAAVSVEVADDRDVEIAIARAIESAGTTIDALRAEAACGRFESDQARLAWFAISPFFD